MSAIAISDNLYNYLHTESKSIFNTNKNDIMTKYIDNKTLIKYYKKIDFLFKKIELGRAHLDVIFVFGSANKIHSREKFLHHVQTNNQTPFNFITIEQLYADIVMFSKVHKGVSAKRIELAHLELEAINHAYSILLFPESPGSFAELGFFSASKETRNKILIMNNLEFDNEDSYVNELIKLVHEEKQVNPFYFSEGSESNTFDKYLKKLMYGYRDLEDYTNDIFKPLDSISREMYSLSIIYEIIKYIPYLSVSELKGLLRYIFKQEEISFSNFDKYISSMISLLVVSNLIQRVTIDEKYFFKVIDDNYDLLQYRNFDEKEYKLKLEVSMLTKNIRGIV